MKLCRIFTFCFIWTVSVLAQQTRIDIGSGVEDRRISAKQAELEERRQEIELLALEAQIEAQSKVLMKL